MWHQSFLPRNKFLALIKVASVLHFHAKLYSYSKRNVWALAGNEVKTERVEPCIDAQPRVLGFTN